MYFTVSLIGKVVMVQFVSPNFHVYYSSELTFWLFLLHQGPKTRRWFDSWEFRVWLLGIYCNFTIIISFSG